MRKKKDANYGFIDILRKKFALTACIRDLKKMKKKRIPYLR